MPTATLTTESYSETHIIPLRASSAASKVMATDVREQQASIASTLRSLYNRAARAFLHRDVALAHSLSESAFAILPPKLHQDALADQRRKWDILRITLEVTVYTSPPTDSAAIPSSLRSNAMLSAQSLVSALHARSLQMFTPTKKPDAAFLPFQVLVTLALASMKTDCPAVGRAIIEEWLARRGHSSMYAGAENMNRQSPDGYEKVLDVYCLNVLPMLEEWDYALEFLEYETELEPSRRQNMVDTLLSLRAQSFVVSRSRTATPPSSSLQSTTSAVTALPTPSDITPRPSRSPSPTPSTSSQSSSTSTRTAVPSKPRRSTPINGLTPLSSTRGTQSSTASSAASSAASSRTATPAPGTTRPVAKFRERAHASSSSSTSSGLPNGHALVSALNGSAPAASSTLGTSPSVFTLLRAALRPYLDRGFAAPKFIALFVLFVLLPALSLLLRIRRKRLALAGAAGNGSRVAEDVRRRLGDVQKGSVWRRVWEEAVRAVGDTVKMSGRGLV